MQRNLIYPNSHPGYRSGIYYVTDPYIISSSSSSNIPNNTLCYIPLFVPQPISIDRIGIFVGTGLTGSLCRLGLYSNSDGLPKNLIFDSGDISCATAGFKEAVVSAFLVPNYYWIGANSSVASPSLYSVSARLGNKFFIGETAPSVSNSVAMLQQSSVTYGAMPTIAPISSLSYGNIPPVFWFRAG
ncbi:hypothetical protein NSTC745_06417 [Nostoc sp. DSM 114161]|jgi:hypothetical protein|uniref:hypothetical protein n=1 Tax=Nostoc sp. DSM 114161 TaxID=3440143 RepID=UPI004046256D